MLSFGELDYEDCILGRQPDQHHQADLKIDIIFESTHPFTKRGAEHAERHSKNYREWYNPAFVLRCQEQEYEQQREAEGQYDLALSFDFLVREPGPFVTVIFWQHFGGQPLDSANRLARTVARRGGALDLDGVIQIVARDRVGAAGRFDAGQVAERHHPVGVGADPEVADIVGTGTELRLRLQYHLIGMAKQVELVDI